MDDTFNDEELIIAGEEPSALTQQQLVARALLRAGMQGLLESGSTLREARNMVTALASELVSDLPREQQLTVLNISESRLQRLQERRVLSQVESRRMELFDRVLSFLTAKHPHGATFEQIWAEVEEVSDLRPQELSDLLGYWTFKGVISHHGDPPVFRKFRFREFDPSRALSNQDRATSSINRLWPLYRQIATGSDLSSVKVVYNLMTAEGHEEFMARWGASAAELIQEIMSRENQEDPLNQRERIPVRTLILTAVDEGR